MHSFTEYSISLSRLASEKTILGDFPPSSKVTLLIVSAESLVTRIPALVDPVKDIISISLCLDIAVPTTSPTPLTRLKTPAGYPASSMTSA